LDVDRELHELAEIGLSTDRTVSATQGFAAPQGITASIDAETSTQAVADAEALRARRVAVDSARAQARAWIAPVKK